MERRPFAHLHVHTEYSLHHGLCRVGGWFGDNCPLLNRVKEIGHDSIAITDHGTLEGALNFYRRAEAAGIKTIFGCEVLVLPDKWPEHSQMSHLLLLAEDDAGYRNLCSLISRSVSGVLGGINKLLLHEHARGLIGFAVADSETARHIGADDLLLAGLAAKEYAMILGDGNFYLELARGGSGSETINAGMLTIHTATGIPLVATCPAHYLYPHEAQSFRLMRRMDRADMHESEYAGDFHMRETAAIYEIFNDQAQALDNTVEVASRCNVRIDRNRARLCPAPILPADVTANQQIRRLCAEALPDKYPEILECVSQRLETELALLTKFDMAGYLLLVADLVRHARNQGISIRAGGPAYGCLVNYLLAITDIDPLRHHLLFERWVADDTGVMNIDFEVEEGRQEELLQYLAQRYGRENAVRVNSVNRVRHRTMLLQVAHYLDIDEERATEIAELLPRGESIANACEQLVEYREILASGASREKQMLLLARGLELLPCGVGNDDRHIALGSPDLSAHVPVVRRTDDKHARVWRTAQCDFRLLSWCGITVLDIRRERWLEVVGASLAELAKRGAVPAFSTYDDTDTLRLINAGETVGIPYLEHEDIRTALRDDNITGFSGLIASIAVERETARYKGDSYHYHQGYKDVGDLAYPHPACITVLAETRGMIVYQEQVMQLVQLVAGYSPDESYGLYHRLAYGSGKSRRRAGKEFSVRAQRNGCARAVAKDICNTLIHDAPATAAKSLFVKWASLAWQCAYLKAHYPREYMQALMKVIPDKCTDYKLECDRMGVVLEMPKCCD